MLKFRKESDSKLSFEVKLEENPTKSRWVSQNPARLPTILKLKKTISFLQYFTASSISQILHPYIPLPAKSRRSGQSVASAKFYNLIKKHLF